MSRAAYNADSDSPKVRAASRRIASILERESGRDNPISSTELGDRVGLKATTVRDIIKEIRPEFEIPVVSCSRGYYVLESVEELEREIAAIDDEIETKRETKRELTQAFNSRRYGE